MIKGRRENLLVRGFTGFLVELPTPRRISYM